VAAGRAVAAVVAAAPAVAAVAAAAIAATAGNRSGGFAAHRYGVGAPAPTPVLLLGQRSAGAPRACYPSKRRAILAADVGLSRTIAARFLIEREIGAGGMGVVYRAVDQATGGPVAVKVLRGHDAGIVARFDREAHVLSELDHPALVRYVAHGVDEGAPYLVMEWLDGEDLGERLAREHLSIAESVEVVRCAATALAAVHARGVVHRDVKPSNLFLVGGRLDRLKVIDFGMARPGGAPQPITRSGVVVGTPSYMAPEQVRGASRVDGRADVFSLGCVLFHCLAGQAPFTGEHVLGVLTKVLLEEAPALSSLVAGVPDELDALVRRMLHKSPAERLVAADVAAALASMAFHDAVAGTRPAADQVAALTAREQRVVSVLLVRGPTPSGEVTLTMDASGPLPDWQPGAETLTIDGTDALVRELGRRGFEFDRLADGTRALMIAGAGAATDQAGAAAECALSARAAAPVAAIALATGRSRLGAQRPTGEAIERAARLLRRAQDRGGACTLVDDVTAGLLEGRFEVARHEDDLMLIGRSAAAGGVRTLLGKPTSCVGRERELRALADLFEECTTEPAAHAVLVTAEAGVGKSRLVHELLDRVRARAEPVEVWSARGDSMRSGAPFGMLGQIVRAVARLVEGEPRDLAREKIAAAVARRVDPGRRRRVAEFLGAMVGVEFPDEESEQLRAARRDPMLMGDQMRRAWVDMVEAECSAQPLVVVLDDLHWGDQPSVEYVDTALRLLREQPLLVIALARPSVREQFAGLWSERRVTEIRLGELSRRACEQLARQALGGALPAEEMRRIAERAGGNAFLLEELVRAAAEGRSATAPGTVMAMVESRLEALDPGARLLLRAGSVFGEVFWLGGVAALLGGGARAEAAGAELAALEKAEWVSLRPEATFQGEKEYAFRHALVRDAAYEMLTEEDRALGHRLAGAWLERVGEPNAVVLAEHFDRGGAPERAVGWYCRAAQQALEGSDLAAAIARAERGVALGASGEDLGALCLIRAEAHAWRGENAEAEQRAGEAMAALPEGSARWYAAAGQLAIAAGRLVRRERLEELAAALSGPAGGAPSAPQLTALAQVATHLVQAGEGALADALMARVEERLGDLHDDPLVRGHLLFGRAQRALRAGDTGTYSARTEESATSFERAGDARNASLMRAAAGYACIDFGAYAEAVERIRAARAEAERLGMRHSVALAGINLGLALARVGAFDEAIALEQEALRDAIARGDRWLEGGARICLAAAQRFAGNLDEAEAEARRALDLDEATSQTRLAALARLAEVRLARGGVDEAIDHARRCLDLADSVGGMKEGETLLRLVYAEALAANGDRAAAADAIRVARERLLARAARIADPARREGFLGRVPESARTLELSRALLNERPPGSPG
jgi:tetratricopeptide (TPR) repeat protein